MGALAVGRTSVTLKTERSAMVRSRSSSVSWMRMTGCDDTSSPLRMWRPSMATSSVGARLRSITAKGASVSSLLNRFSSGRALGAGFTVTLVVKVPNLPTRLTLTGMVMVASPASGGAVIVAEARTPVASRTSTRARSGVPKAYGVTFSKLTGKLMVPGGVAACSASLAGSYSVAATRSRRTTPSGTPW